MKSILQLIKVLLIPLTCFSVTRIIFFLWNYDLYAGVSIMPFIFGVHFDISAVFMYFAPFIFFYLLSNFFKVVSVLEKLFFGIAIFLTTLLNLIDVGFIEFSKKRSGKELLNMAADSDEFFNLLPSYITDYWILSILLILITFASMLWYNSWRKPIEERLPSIIWYILFIGVVILGIRGKISSFSGRPLDTVDAAEYCENRFIPIVLNTPFTFIKSLERKQLKPITYYPNDKLATIYTPVWQSKGTNTDKRDNIVVLILESFGSAFVGHYNDGIDYTPFLDSLITVSRSFTNGFACGTHSAEAVPSIFASVPAFIDEGLIFSEYVNNKTNSLPQVLAAKGYHSAFFHGANNGSMHFDSYTKGIGFDSYFGRDEYNNDEHFDGKWGIYDHHFYDFAIDKISAAFPSPFLASIFSLSSHHPYNIPDNLQSKFKGGPLEIHKSIQYADWSLRQFFKKAKQTEWFNNTLFILCADHTAFTRNKKYRNSLGNYRIPILFYHPNDDLFQNTVDTNIFMQVDIFPTVLDYLNIKDTIITFGNSLFSDKPRYFISQNTGTYQILQNNKLLIFDGNKTKEFYTVETLNNFKKAAINSTEAKELEIKLKAIIQQFNNRLITNQLSVD